LKTFPRKSIQAEISPLRCAPVEMTNGRAAPLLVISCWLGEPQVPPLRCAPVGMTILLGASIFRRLLRALRNCHPRPRSHGPVGPTQGDEKGLLFGNYAPWKHRPLLCHLDRSVAKWRDLRFSGPFLGMFFDRAGPNFLLRLATNTCAVLRKESRIQLISTTISTGNPGERSGGTCGFLLEIFNHLRQDLDRLRNKPCFVSGEDLLPQAAIWNNRCAYSTVHA
jgi:hypothetical protein